MSQSEDCSKVLIVGAGLGGLVLAQVLHKNNVPFELFERDQAPVGRNQGWAVALVETVPILQSIVPEDEMSTLASVGVNHNTGEHDEFAFVQASTGERVALTGGKPLNEPGSFLRANREALRSFLWRSNALFVSANKHFSRYEVDDKGVTAFFRDGTSARGGLLVGADGLYSRVRHQLIDDEHKPALSKFVPLFGELDLSPEQYSPFLELANAGIMAAGPGLRFLIGLLAMEDNRSSARMYWALMSRREEPKSLSDWIQNANSQERYDFALETCQSVHPSLRAVIGLGGPEAILPYQPKFLEFITPESLPDGRVTILGDAAHAMLPFRGAGANTAIVDANDLAGLLVEAHKQGVDPSTVVPTYLSNMIPRGKEAVLSSRAGGGAAMDDPAAYFKNFLRTKN